MVFPENAQNKSLTWSSSDASVCSVNSSGSVTALKMGTVSSYLPLVHEVGHACIL